MPYEIAVEIDHAVDAAIDAAFLTAVAERTLTQEAAPEGVVSLVVTDDETVRALNREYRGIDEPTDVLSFGLGGLSQPLDDSPADAFIVPADAPLEIGEIIISYPYAARTAAATGRTPREEIALLVTHGVLHLLGHDHLEEDEGEQMRERERRVLSAFDIDRYP